MNDNKYEGATDRSVGRAGEIIHRSCLFAAITVGALLIALFAWLMN